MQVFELADEFNLTSVEAAEICVAAGVVDATAATDLTDAQVARWRTLAAARADWLAREARAPVGVASSEFGPLPAAPWETPSADDDTAASVPPWADPQRSTTVHAPPAVDTRPPPLSPYAPAALALSVISLIIPFVVGIGALALGWYAKDRIDRSEGQVRGRSLATAAQVVAAIGIVGWTLLLVASIYQDARSSRTDDGQVETGLIGWDEIGVGRCVRIPRADLAVENWMSLDCAEPHEAEVYATERVAPTTNPNEPYPGRASLVPGATRLCEERFAAYIGEPYAASDLRIAVYFPTPSNWDASGDRTIGCIVFRDDYALIDSTLAGSGT